MGVCYSVKTRSFYDLSFSYKSLPDDLIPISRDDHQKLLSAINGGKELAVEDGKLVLVDRPPDPLTWEQVRKKRNALLADSDWTQMPDWHGASKPIWAAYRQSLRDIPQMFERTADIAWPAAPRG